VQGRGTGAGVTKGTAGGGGGTTRVGGIGIGAGTVGIGVGGRGSGRRICARSCVESINVAITKAVVSAAAKVLMGNFSQLENANIVAEGDAVRTSRTRRA
jgi:hypothetical protein